MIGSRIKLARKKAGYSLRGLADALNGKVSAQAIGKYERDEMTPSSDVLIALSKTLEVSIHYLLNSQQVELTNVDFRTKANTTGKDRARVETEVIEWVERYLEIEHILEMKSAEWKKPFDKVAINSVAEAEAVAIKLRDVWNLGTDPIPNMTELLEEKGLKVLVSELPSNVSGFTCLVQGARISNLPIIVINSQVSLERRRLTLAHELGHRLIDPEHLSEKEEEQACNRFAAAFLVPKSHLENEVGHLRHSFGYRELIYLKQIYRVSGAALLVRLRNIGIITDAILTYSFQTIARTWRSSEPEPLENEDERGQKEKPCRFERLCYRALAEDLISTSKAAELLRYSIDKVEAELKGEPHILHIEPVSYLL
ncbi:putative Zn peptidase (plasmid) [Synechococcus sp. PCC 7502]|uniref:helix-turn-helix domain-containing protein n=1 Tax=Synechococcus sp. PCC 7502 TaxID=1173263 RepID=UPI00029FA4F5|nr:XRE family transcriptional regulator [Synechococcus sp. PCC 7502]AFY75443.1 putative Zn peptidase [Synechococcus sp. PCC 7502]